MAWVKRVSNDFAHFLILEMRKFWKCDQMMRCSLALGHAVNDLNQTVIEEARMDLVCTTEPTLTDLIASQNPQSFWQLSSWYAAV